MGSRLAASRHLDEAGHDGVQSPGILGKAFREDLEVRDGALERFGIFGKHRIDPSERIARGLRHALTRRRISDERLRRSRSTDLLATLQRDNRNAGQALEISPTVVSA